MKYLIVLTLGFIFFGCNHDNKSKWCTKIRSETIKSTDVSKDKDEIQNLIRQMLKWANSKNSIDLLPILSKDSICVGFDLNKLRVNLEKLKETGFFANEFVNNYNQIILTLDKKIKSKEFEEWNIYELPTFNFANDVDPWCLCQDEPSENPYDFVLVEIINLTKEHGELNWKWGNLNPGGHPSWKEFAYRFEVVKENNKWKITYLKGFDFKDSTR